MSLASFGTGACTDDSHGAGASALEGFLPATLLGGRRCPARADYMELCFRTSEGPWNWCFPRPARRRRRSAAPIALTLGPYGVVARSITPDGGFGAAVDACAALPAILAGTEVIVARYLVTAGR